mmetsp:Transcript_965/g.4076  ORF Transcript_965/g.4076 Transcript_965/m.4076 type:complete len:427 (-) Transcript_965:3381-4661(-)
MVQEPLPPVARDQWKDRFLPSTLEQRGRQLLHAQQQRLVGRGLGRVRLTQRFDQGLRVDGWRPGLGGLAHVGEVLLLHLLKGRRDVRNQHVDQLLAKRTERFALGDVARHGRPSFHQRRLRGEISIPAGVVHCVATRSHAELLRSPLGGPPDFARGGQDEVVVRIDGCPALVLRRRHNASSTRAGLLHDHLPTLLDYLTPRGSQADAFSELCMLWIHHRVPQHGRVSRRELALPMEVGEEPRSLSEAHVRDGLVGVRVAHDADISVSVEGRRAPRLLLACGSLHVHGLRLARVGLLQVPHMRGKGLLAFLHLPQGKGLSALPPLETLGLLRFRLVILCSTRVAKGGQQRCCQATSIKGPVRCGHAEGLLQEPEHPAMQDAAFVDLPLQDVHEAHDGLAILLAFDHAHRKAGPLRVGRLLAVELMDL